MSYVIRRYNGNSYINSVWGVNSEKEAITEFAKKHNYNTSLIECYRGYWGLRYGKGDFDYYIAIEYKPL